MRHLARAVTIGLLGLAAACGGDITSPSEVAGTYALQSVEGEALPFVLQDDQAGKFEITSGEMVLSDAGTFVITAALRSTVDGKVTTSPVTSEGSFTVSGSTIRLAYQGGPLVTGTIAGNTLTIVENGVTLVFSM